ncbi:hypothetical protein ACFQH2_17680 [Natronoarchaeum sp. GCM10025703]
MSDQNTLRNTVLGAIVTLLLSFTTVSPVLGVLWLDTSRGSLPAAA